MENKIIKQSRFFNHYNLNFAIDNVQIIVHNFMVEAFENIPGFATHQHSSYELHYIKEGYGTVGFDEKTCSLKPGDVFMMAPYTLHDQEVSDSGMIEYALRFDVKKLCSHTNNPTVEEEADQLISMLETSANQVFSDKFHLEDPFERGYREAFYKKPGYYISVKQCLMDIIIGAARLSFDESSYDSYYDLPTHSIDAAQFDRVTEFIHDNMMSHISNQSLAQYIHISERQLHRLVKKQIGLSPHQYVTLLRINYVKNLIDERAYSLKAISEMAGFSSEFHLSSAFKKFEKMTPREYIHKSEDLNQYEDKTNNVVRVSNKYYKL